jgi:hypothetical protein
MGAIQKNKKMIRQACFYKKEKIFGYNLVLSTSVEVQLNIELPVAVTNIVGNAKEGSQIIQNKEQVHNHHHAEVKIDIADARYDIIANYAYIRGKGSIPKSIQNLIRLE